MNQLSSSQIIIIIGILLMIAEILLGAATGFELLIIGITFILGGTIGVLTGSLQWAIGTIVILDILYIIFGRQLIRNKFDIETKKTNVDNLMGKKGVVVKNITESAVGQIKVDGEIWRAKADKSLKEGDKVTVVSVSGITLHVE